MASGLKAAVIGCGRMGAFTNPAVRQHAPAVWFPLSHAEAIVAEPRLLLAAFGDHDLSAARRAGETFGVPAIYDDPQRLLDETRPDLVCLATRTVGRADLIARCAAAGVRAMHAEKPLCNSMREWHALRELLAGGRLRMTYGALRRHFPIYRAALEQATSGRHGELREVRVQLGAGALFWTQIHAIDLILFAAQGRRLTGVQARFDVVTGGTNPREVVNDPVVVSAMLYFEGGLAGVITRALGSDCIFSCTDAELAVRADGATIDVYRSPPGGGYPSHQALALPASALHAGRGGSLAPIGLLADGLLGVPGSDEALHAIERDMLEGQRIAFAMLQSHLEGSRIVDPRSVADDIVIHARTGDRHA